MAENKLMTEDKESALSAEEEKAEALPAPPADPDGTKGGKCLRLLSRWEEWLSQLFLFCFTGVFLELALHLIVFGWGGRRMVYPLLFGVIAGVLFSFISSYLPRLPSRILTGLLIGAQIVYAEVQLVYHAAFGNMMTVSQVAMGGGVFANFGSQIMYCVGKNIGYVLLLLVPGAVTAAVFILRRGRFKRPGWRQALVSFAGGALCAFAAFILMWVGRGAPTSAYDIFVSPNSPTDISYANVGMYATTAQELRFIVFGVDENAMLKSGALPGSVTKFESYTSKKYNMIDGLDLEAVAAASDNEELAQLDRYVAGLAPTSKNDHTGALRGYNVITVCAESFSPLLISEEMTPTLYKMANNGFVFTNFYGTFQSVTTNGEYTFCTGLLPDMSRSKAQASFDLAGKNYLPFTLAHVLSGEGYVCLGYHNYLGDFYNRVVTHKNIGYDFRAIGYGLDVELQWPGSDLEMMEKSVDDYLTGDKPFHAYYMTFSGHYQYNWDNPMCAKHRSEVEHLPYSDTVKAYISCNLEVEYAMEYLMRRLDETGKLNNTVIVLTCDHYPYGLNEDEYSELAGRPIDTVFERYRNSFICYAPGIGDPVVCDEYCSTEDIVPTLLDLLGLEYDSRLFAGVDVLSDAPHVAILSDGSFITDGFRYNAATGEAEPINGAGAPSAEKVAAYRSYVENKFNFSAQVLNLDYYAHLFGMESSEGTDGLVFYDVSNVFTQVRVFYLYNRGLVDGVGEHEFGGLLPASLGEYVDVLYRYSGRPAAGDASALMPAPFTEDGAFGEGDKYRDAVNWAFDAGYLCADDPLMKPSESIDHLVASLLLYRFAADHGVDVDLSADERYGEYLPYRDGLTDEQFAAVLFFELGSLNDLKDLTAEEFMTNLDMQMTRFKMVTHVFFLIIQHLETTG